MILRGLWAGIAVVVPLVILVNVAVESVPHARGIAFFVQLRYAATIPVCIAGALGSALVYARFENQFEHPRWLLAAFLLAVSLVAVAVMAILGPRGLVRAGAPAILVGASTIALLVPRFMEREPGVAATVTIVLLGVLELVGFVAALSSERRVQEGPDGLAFDVPREMFDVDHKFVDLPSGARVHYVDEGKGPTLLFLHGNPAWSFQWRELIRALRGSYRCVALDYPGFGLSDAPPGYGFTPREQSFVVDEFVARLRLKDLTLVMQDWGGPIGLGFAGRHPELVRGVVLGATWTAPTTSDMARGKFSLIAGGPVGEFAQVNFNALARFAVKSSIVHNVSQDVLDMYLRPFRPLGPRRGIAAFYPGQITAATDYFREVDANLPRLVDKPALILWPLRDPGSGADDRERFEAIFPKHRTIELRDASHFFFEDAADVIISEVRSFVPLDEGAACASDERATGLQ
jgi:pimeloyl-ACP methyl ester carboxylesterase